MCDRCEPRLTREHDGLLEIRLAHCGSMQVAVAIRPGLLPQALDAGAALLAFERASPCEALVGLVARRGLTGATAASPDQLDQALARVGAVALLGAVALRDDDDARRRLVRRLPASRIRRIATSLGSDARAAHVEAQLHRGRELVDVLPARTGARTKLSSSSRSSMLIDR